MIEQVPNIAKDVTDQVRKYQGAQSAESSAREVKPTGNPAMSSTGMDGHGVRQAIGG